MQVQTDTSLDRRHRQRLLNGLLGNARGLNYRQDPRKDRINKAAYKAYLQVGKLRSTYAHCWKAIENAPN